MKQLNTDVIVIGSGIAGLITALEAAKHHHVILTTKDKLTESNTRYAQGGIAVALTTSDSPDLHYNDTLKAGNYHNNTNSVTILTREGPTAIQDLIKYGVEFDKTNNNFDLNKEGAHSQARVLHSKDSTGIAITNPLIKQVIDHPNISILEHCTIVELSIKNQQCVGCYAIQHDSTIAITAQNICLTTGGAGQLFSHTSNPPIATGAGLALAYEAGCSLIDLEFIQFHPTSIHLNKENRYFLITEALRGAGARLINNHNEYIMSNIHPDKELAPRDIVSQAIYNQLCANNQVYLDCTSLKSSIKDKFPTIYSIALTAGYDLCKTAVPIIPTAHYMMGGILTNNNAQTTISHLYAIGEVSCNGLHGANRLASNSLLEGLVFAKRAVKSFKTNNQVTSNLPKKTYLHQTPTATDQNQYNAIKSIMWQQCGITRNSHQLADAINQLSNLLQKKPFHNVHSWSHMPQIAMLICQAALQRTESLGSHQLESSKTASHPYWITQNKLTGITIHKEFPITH